MNNLSRPEPATFRSPTSPASASVSNTPRTKKPPDPSNHSSSNNVVPSPASSNKKPPQRRTPWACDECRLRKRKCDGVDPCTPCARSALECSYHFRRPAPPQTQRIQMLEIHLRYVRNFLQDASRKVPKELGVDFEGVLRKISGAVSVLPETDDEGTGSGHPLSERAGNEQSNRRLSSRDQVDGRSPRSQYAKIPHPAFLKMLVQELGGADFAAADGFSETVDNLFNMPLDDERVAATAALPSRQQALRLIDAVFDSQHPMLAFLHEQYFRDTVDMVYTATSKDDAIDRFLPLLHIILGLGYLFCRSVHEAGHNEGRAGCEVALEKATAHYLSSRALLQPLGLSTMTTLQALLCSVVWLISTCRIEEAHPSIGLAVSLALRLGLHVSNISLPAEEKMLRGKVFAAIVHIDAYASMILGLPMFLGQADVDFDMFDGLVKQATAERDGQTSAALAQLSLLLICRRDHGNVAATDTDTGLRMQQIKSWEKKSATLLRHVAGDEYRNKRSRLHVEMLHNFVLLDLWREQLIHTIRVDTDVDVEDTDSDTSEFVTACVQLAAKTSSCFERAVRDRAFEPFGWSSVYTLFVSTTYLITLMSAQSRSSLLQLVQQQIVQALQLLAAGGCSGDFGPASTALSILESFLETANVDVSVDVEEIVNNTRQICGGGAAFAARHPATSRQDDIMALLNSHRQDASSTASMSRSPSTTTTADEMGYRNGRNDL